MKLKLAKPQASVVSQQRCSLLKASGIHGVQRLTNVIGHVWQTGVIPLNWKKGVILPVCNGKGSSKECNNYRCITLLSMPGKVFATVLLNKVRDLLLSQHRKKQSGFTPGHSTVNCLSH